MALYLLLLGWIPFQYSPFTDLTCQVRQGHLLDFSLSFKAALVDAEAGPHTAGLKPRKSFCPSCQALSGFLCSSLVTITCLRSTFILSALVLQQPLVHTICLDALVTQKTLSETTDDFYLTIVFSVMSSELSQQSGCSTPVLAMCPGVVVSTQRIQTKQEGKRTELKII